MNFKYKTVFSSEIKVYSPDKIELLEAKASLDGLKPLLPYDINPEDDTAIVYVAGNLAVGGMVNLNDDAVSTEDTLRIYRKFEKQQCNIEHDRKEIVGYIVKAGLSEIGTNRLISENDARESGKPFNVATVAALWKVANKPLCDFILESVDNPDAKDPLSLSFEVGFNTYDIAVVGADGNIANAGMTIKSSSPEFQEYNGYLRANGGTGLKGSQKVVRLLSGDIIPLGQGIVAMPAAAVKGLTVISEVLSPTATDSISSIEDVLDASVEIETLSITKDTVFDKKDIESASAYLISFAEKFQIQEKYTNTLKSSVSPSISSNNLTNSKHNSLMTLADLKLKAEAATDVAALKETFASAVSLADAVAKESERLATELAAKELVLAEVEKAKVDAIAAKDSLASELEKVKQTLAEIKATQETALAEQKFNDRMTALESEFDLDDEDRGYLVDEIKSIDSDESFAAWFTKKKKLMKEKTKAYKADMKEKADCAKKEFKKFVKKDKAADDAEDAKDDGDDEDSEDAKAALLSAVANIVDAPVDTTISAASTKSLAEQLQESFAEGLSFGGRSAADFKKSAKKE